jgi:DNA-binding NarL/FixJ family response regulator
MTRFDQAKKMIQVAIVEDNLQYRTTISIILQLDENIKLQHKGGRCEEVLPLFETERPDVVLMDIDLPGMSGIQGVWNIKKKWPEVKVLMLTVFEDEGKIFGAIKAGANGYLLKKDNPQHILNAIKAVYQGESPMNGMIAAKVLDYFQHQSQSGEMLLDSNLTEREQGILQLLIKGLSYKEIAGSIFISTETLNSHIKNIYRKLNVHSRSELAARYRNI